MTYQQGNLITNFKNKKYDLIGHQCNVFHLGAGVAAKLLEDFPEIQVQDDTLDAPNRRYGNYSSLTTEYGDIVNIYSQFRPGACEDVGLDTYVNRLDHLIKALKQINMVYTGKHIGLPLIGSGLAASRELKQDRDDLTYFRMFVAPIIEATLTDLEITIVYL